MSRKFSIAVLLLVFVAGLMVIGQTSHALQTAPAAQEHGAMGGPGMAAMTPESRLKMLTEKLNLTADQQAKLKPILEDQSKQMKAVHESAGAKVAEKALRTALAEHGPCIAWVDMAHLPHRAMPGMWSGGGYHVVTVYAIKDEDATALIGDLTDDPISIPLADLAAARWAWASRD